MKVTITQKNGTENLNRQEFGQNTAECALTAFVIKSQETAQADNGRQEDGGDDVG